MGTSRDILRCVPRLQEAWAHLLAEWTKQNPDGPTVFLVETYRSAAVQAAYYAQGRLPVHEINKLREVAGLPAIGEKEGKRIITYKQAGGSKHQLQPAKAFDIGFSRNGKMIWSDDNYAKAAVIIRSAFPDVTWGADWNKNGRTTDERLVDRPHFEV